MVNPGIETSAAPKKKGCLPFALVAGTALAAGALALSQCSSDEPQADAPAQPKNDEIVYQYRASTNITLQDSLGKDVVVEDDSCLTGMVVNGENIVKNAQGDVGVTAIETGTGKEVSGYINPFNFMNNGVRREGFSCTATFVQAMSPAENIRTDGPQVAWRVMGGADLYSGPDETSAQSGYVGDGSCGFSTGRTRGGMMEVTLTGRDETITVWVKKENFSPRPLPKDQCQAKLG